MTVSLFGRKEYFIRQKSVCRLGVCAKVLYRFLNYQLDLVEPGQTVHITVTLKVV